jgi:ribonucleoside-diphosphate reductase alpha chain
VFVPLCQAGDTDTPRLKDDNCMETASLPDVGIVSRHFTTPGTDPFETVEWERRDAKAGDFFQANVEVPTFWTDDSIGIVAKLYFATVDGVREDSVRQMIGRVANKITHEGMKQGHFGEPHRYTGKDIFELNRDNPARVFHDELRYVCLHQYAGFNTPTWLNIGVPGREQCGHACYPLSIEDHMLGDGGIVDWWRKEASIFKLGGGSGINLSKLRGSMEPLSTGGEASGPVAYIRPSNAGAETLKSGGAHRRAAKFICLDDDHPDIEDFIDCKVREDERMRILAEAGLEDFSTFTAIGERNIAEATSFQSANHSVCASDSFMEMATQVDASDPWELRSRVSGEVVEVVSARGLLYKVAEAAWKCADPGLIFIDTINKWHTTPSLGPVTTTNTCGEVTQNDDTACNLSALNVLKFLDFKDAPVDVSFDIDGFCHVVDVMATAMDIVCGFSELPTPEIEQNTRDLRQLGMGFTNLGAAIMAQGYPYDSDEGRAFAAAITALLTGRVYNHSAVMAHAMKPFKHFATNRDRMLDVIDMHMSYLPEPATKHQSELIACVWEAACDNWAGAAEGGHEAGYRNSLATSMMPTGTVSFLLGADTTGVEPAISLVTRKKLAAAGEMTLVNRSAHLAAVMLGGYSDENLKQMAEGDFSCVAEEDKATFATAIGENFVEPMGHVRMVAAIQPFVSQAISKTTNLPYETTVEEILELYVEAWRMGVKVLSVYRDGSKATQVLTAATEKARELVPGDGKDPAETYQEPVDDQIARQIDPRMRMPRTRQSITHKIHIRSTVGDQEGYITAGIYPDGRLGEIFLEGFGKHGGFTQNSLAAWATDFSIGLQYGVPMEVLCRKHAYMSDETGGMVVPSEDEQVMLRTCTSIVDYIARWIAGTFGDVDLQEELGVMTAAVKQRKEAQIGMTVTVTDTASKDLERASESVTRAVAQTNGHARSLEPGPPCNRCGGRMFRAGACWQCSCGNNTGCG